jgi:rhodanese-related sulfurtransferase
MKKSVLIISVSLIALVFAGCTSFEVKNYDSLKAMTDDAKASVEFISAYDLSTVLQSSEKFYLIDCREQNEFDTACIKGAINIPRGLMEFSISDKAPDRNAPVYVYCSNGDRSALVAQVLPYLKYSNVKVVEGGFDAWQAKYPKLVEIHPVRGDSKAKGPSKPSGGCGG